MTPQRAYKRANRLLRRSVLDNSAFFSAYSRRLAAKFQGYRTGALTPPRPISQRELRKWGLIP